MQCVYKCFYIDRLTLGSHHEVDIIKIPWPGVEHAPAQDCLHFFRQDRFDGISPYLDQFIFKIRVEGIPDGIRGDNVAGGDIDL